MIFIVRILEYFDMTVPPSVYKIVSETKRKVAAGRSHGSCGSALRNYGSCHGCSFVDGVFAPRGGCPNHKPRKLHPSSIPFPYYFTYPLMKPREPPLPFSSSSTLYLHHQLPPPLHTLYSSNILTDALHHWYRRGSIDACRGRLEMIYRKLESWRLSITFPSSHIDKRNISIPFFHTTNFDSCYLLL